MHAWWRGAGMNTPRKGKLHVARRGSEQTLECAVRCQLLRVYPIRTHSAVNHTLRRLHANERIIDLSPLEQTDQAKLHALFEFPCPTGRDKQSKTTGLIKSRVGILDFFF